MRQVDVLTVGDDARFNRFHARILFWCALIIVFDGYDLAVAGIALPSIMKSMGVDATAAGVMVSSALFGMMFGAIVMGMAADRLGRPRTIALCVALFSIFTAAAGLSPDPVTFAATRFLAGLGIGGVMPIVVAQMTEYAPKRLRSTLVTLMFSGYSVGGVVAALLGKALIEQYGWQSVFLAAGLPVLFVPLMLRGLPESKAFLLRQGRLDTLRGVVRSLEPSYRVSGDMVFASSNTTTAAGAPIRRLFDDGRGRSTVMLWVAFFMCLFMVYALSSWLAKLMAGAGFTLGSALNFVLALNIGAMAGAIGGGWLADRFQIRRVLIGMYLLAAVSISLLGFKMPTPLLFFFVALAGASTIGTQIVTYAYAGQFYPAEMRGTGIGWASGVGRSGAILAPIVIGVLVAMSLPLHQNFLAMAVPAVIAAAAVSLIDHRRAASMTAAASPVASAVPGVLEVALAHDAADRRGVL
ncbi:MFS transporter [Chitinasiproducens palmae]|uniref:MFS transporter, AAHS family, benzoate transport protein n=1 Tax=Chitinasiproducens palmae TaxID=1770053 RepID=A0A1H2PIU4_9BURK|nr:MFS transporter [Chitinasiproducens palmae]SDV46183.1 MFS transporter, AAHS family, benzoate transport protein [Chitinasiproducens palmae]